MKFFSDFNKLTKSLIYDIIYKIEIKTFFVLGGHK